jgi:uncharacterized protein YbaR (Trm112 family)
VTDTQQTIEPWLRDILRCPQCKGELTDATHGTGPAAVVELRCPVCRLAYPIESGVPVLLIDLARHIDA